MAEKRQRQEDTVESKDDWRGEAIIRNVKPERHLVTPTGVAGRRAQVRKMFDRGLSAQAIAKRLGAPVGTIHFDCSVMELSFRKRDEARGKKT
jgi:DNA-binding NarL/FixJ family response regulator